jgi:MFS-type transporter involved in bile tolerance (Atg22 family)
MSPDHENPAENREPNKFNFTLAAVVGQVGCLTLVIVLAALFGGMWLDSYFDTRPMITVGLMIVSIPVTLLVMLLIVRVATSRLGPDSKKDSSLN